MNIKITINEIIGSSQTYNTQSNAPIPSGSRASNLGLKTQELTSANPWLESEGRISADGSFILIKVGEALAVPEDKKNLASLKYETNQADVDNTHLNLDIRTDLNFDFEQRQNETDGNVIGDSDWEAGMPTDILNGDGFTNTEVSKIVSDNHRPGNKELHDDSLSINFNNNLDNIYNNQQNNSIFDSNYDPFQNIFSDLLKNTGWVIRFK
tara:strand:+ start:1649 stop:2278 length:630 start_codon:yes stop_codon:yes gene_type:complete